MIERDVLNLKDFQNDCDLTEKQQRYVSCVQNGQPDIDVEAIQRLMTKLKYPIHFLDFETDNAAIPRFEGLHPYDKFPFQYSCHVLYSNGTIKHYEYLHTDMFDPRKPLLKSLLNAVSSRGSVVVYNVCFEKGVLESLSESFHEHAHAIESIINRLWDQLDIFKHHYTHPDFCGSNSLKKVLPVLVPSLCYEDLSVQEGTEAQAIWNQMINTANKIEKNKLIKDLKAYCERDTLATLEIHKVLQGY